MFKVRVRQKFHGLGDDATEAQFFDRTRFQHFLGRRLGDDLPDAKTLWDFQPRLEADGRAGRRQLFEAFGQMLAGQGLLARAGRLVDASLVDAPRQRHDRGQNQRLKQGERPAEFEANPAVGRQKDRAARWTKKHHEAHYGWKHPVQAGLKTKLIRHATTTPASVHDSQVFAELLDDQDQAVLAASAYHSAEHEAQRLQLNAQEFLLRKATRSHPLSEAEPQTNHTISRMRVRVEHLFAHRAQMGADLCRSIGLKRATPHNHLSNLVYHMDR